MSTVIAFRKWRDSGDVIAVCPEIPAHATDISLCYSYEHFGQSGALSEGCYLHDLVPASPDEYADLLAELERVWQEGRDNFEIVEATDDLFERYETERRLPPVEGGTP
jgi:hypothetical protein